jgi:phosphate/sulfate permease
MLALRGDRGDVAAGPVEAHDQAASWHVAQDIVLAWIFTIPATAIIGAVSYKLASMF